MFLDQDVVNGVEVGDPWPGWASYDPDRHARRAADGENPLIMPVGEGNDR